MKRSSSLLLFLAALASGAWADDSVKIASPDGKIVAELRSDGGKLQYLIQADGRELLPASPLGLTVDGVNLGQGARFSGKPGISEIDETYSVIGNHAQARNHAREAVIPVETAGKAFGIIVRVYDDGFAVRYRLPDGAVRIDGEATGWQLPESVSKIAWQELSQCYEGFSHVTAIGKVPEGKFILGPLTIALSGRYLSLSEADCENFSDMGFTLRGNLLSAGFPFAAKGWAIKRRAGETRPGVLGGTDHGHAVSPWRTTIIARDLSGVINSDLLMNLCPPPAPGTDFSWVKPGRSLWAWWSVDTPPYAELPKWYDAAAKLNWDYFLVDWGWDKWRQPGKDEFACMKDLVDYGQSKGVKTLAWVHSNKLRDAKIRRAWLEKLAATGASGVKIDFHPDATADYMQWYMGAMQDCAELKLLVNFHGSIKQTGLQRTYPNDITREAVRGNEWHMTKYHRVAPLEQDVALPFTRPLAGPADVTTVMLNPKELATAGFTWPHEMAQAVIYQSSVTHFADHYQFILGNPMEDLFRTIPVTWDETRVLACTEMGEVVAYARRKGETWWIGVMNGATEREVRIPLDFLKRAALGTLVYDDPKTAAAVERREQRVSPADVLKINLRPAGGFVSVIR